MEGVGPWGWTGCPGHPRPTLFHAEIVRPALPLGRPSPQDVVVRDPKSLSDGGVSFLEQRRAGIGPPLLGPPVSFYGSASSPAPARRLPPLVPGSSPHSRLRGSAPRGVQSRHATGWLPHWCSCRSQLVRLHAHRQARSLPWPPAAGARLREPSGSPSSFGPPPSSPGRPSGSLVLI